LKGIFFISWYENPNPILNIFLILDTFLNNDH